MFSKTDSVGKKWPTDSGLLQGGGPQTVIIPGYWIQSVAMGDREEPEELFHQVTPTSFLVIGVYIYIYMICHRSIYNTLQSLYVIIILA